MHLMDHFCNDFRTPVRFWTSIHDIFPTCPLSIANQPWIMEGLLPLLSGENRARLMKNLHFGRSGMYFVRVTKGNKALPGKIIQR